jgi:thioredoxin-like negative regulator of GroEL
MSAVPSPLQFRGSATLPPGEYTLRFAVADGERLGTVEHPVTARLAPAGSVQLSELLLGGPVEGGEPLQPSVGHTVNFGLLHGYLEAVGPDAGRLRVRYEVASSDSGEAILSADVEPVRAGERAIFAHVMPVRRLPEGEYVLRATILDPERRDAQPISTLTRPFEVARPPVLMAPAEGGGGSLAVAVSDVFLPVDDNRLNRPFDRRDVVRRDVLQAFRARVAPQSSDVFDRGVSQLSDGDYPRAETSFKSAIQIDADSTAPIAYLAATFAAAGADQQAAGAWQTALIDGADLPQIFLWLGDALIRTRDMVQARSILEEGATKWPSDVRFNKPLALVYATFGLGREAVRLLERHLDEDPRDTEGLAMAVEWIYHLHTAGAVATNRGEDLRRAREYAEAYVRAGGPQAALVKQWLNAIEIAAP